MNFDQGTCPHGFVFSGSSCYYISSERLRASEAFAACHAMNSRLAWIETEEELCWLASLMQAQSIQRMAVGGKGVGRRQFKWVDFGETDSG